MKEIKSNVADTRKSITSEEMKEEDIYTEPTKRNKRQD